MVEGAMRHGTDMKIEQNFVDSHGASFVGFANGDQVVPRCCGGPPHMT
jgi:hypothetical protein